MNFLIAYAVVVLGIVGEYCYAGSFFSDSFFSVPFCTGLDDDNYRLEENFYREKCPLAESIVQNITCASLASNRGLPSQLLRLHFHDAFVRGCEASVLLDSTANNTAEKDAPPNLSLGGFAVIDAIKAKLEEVCPGTVSCADVLALAARDAVSCSFNKSMWEVDTGRRDGYVSLASEAQAQLPSEFSNYTTLRDQFAYKGLSAEDLVTLSGAHVIGIAHCKSFSSRLYNYSGNGGTDPSLNSTYAASLKKTCPSLSDTKDFVPMDPAVPGFSHHYYTNLEENQGLFTSDAALLTDPVAKSYVDQMSTDDAFFAKFACSMKRMGAIGVLTGDSGEIRQKCYAVNPAKY